MEIFSLTQSQTGNERVQGLAVSVRHSISKRLLIWLFDQERNSKITSPTRSHFNSISNCVNAMALFSTRSKRDVSEVRHDVPSPAHAWPHIPTAATQLDDGQVDDMIRLADSAHAAFKLMEGSADPHSNVWGVLKTLAAIRCRVLSRRELHSQNVKDILWKIDYALRNQPEFTNWFGPGTREFVAIQSRAIQLVLQLKDALNALD
ncbi:hypothetical protein HYPSUDRAFT_35979 [Hypholoma sublateritium FD-334 SS-4]|uniref:Uncharacterized protein n=1 Tax=Hypholoma sublateritium (strain FD-334 SS-4) TaxID=945553 RepID=A0A0D2MS57_HYPSF|nr:hypothetical protein HYPSUDRAFT_35979 [Hypholoma sublateritium FD-334 SS-4]